CPIHGGAFCWKHAQGHGEARRGGREICGRSVSPLSEWVKPPIICICVASGSTPPPHAAAFRRYKAKPSRPTARVPISSRLGDSGTMTTVGKYPGSSNFGAPHDSPNPGRQPDLLPRRFVVIQSSRNLCRRTCLGCSFYI